MIDCVIGLGVQLIRSQLALIFAERPTEQLFVKVRARDLSGTSFEVVWSYLLKPLDLEQLFPEAVHLKVLLGRGKLSTSMPREVSPPGNVQLVVGDMADAGLDHRSEIGEHVVDRLAGPPEDEVDTYR